MDLRKEEGKSRSNKRVLSEVDVSEWGITYKEIRPRESKQSCDIVNKFQSPTNFCPAFAIIVDNLGISDVITRTLSSPNPSSRIRTPEQLEVITARSRASK
jgi:hypothetical protein